MEGTLQSEGPWTLLAPTDAMLDDAGFNVRFARACMAWHGDERSLPDPTLDTRHDAFMSFPHGVYVCMYVQLTLSVASREPQRHLGRILAYHIVPGRRAGLTEFVSSGDNVRGRGGGGDRKSGG